MNKNSKISKIFINILENRKNKKKVTKVGPIASTLYIPSNMTGINTERGIGPTLDSRSLTD